MTHSPKRGTRSLLPRPARFPLGALISALLLSGCASVFQGDGGNGGSTNAPLNDHLAGTADVIVSITSGGGFVPIEFNLRNVPEFLLLGDGTAIVGGVTIAIYPGPAIARLQSTTLSEGQIQELLNSAQTAGLLGEELDFGEPGVTDMPYTTVTIRANGRTVTQSAYALGFPADPSSGLSEPQIAARAALQGFVDAAQASVGSASGGYEPDGVVVFRLGPAEGAPAGEPELEQSPQIWPIATAPQPPTGSEPGGASCVVVTGSEVPILLDALAAANELTPWVIGSDPPARLVFRPYLPGDPGCE